MAQSPITAQQSQLFPDEDSPAARWGMDAGKRALDELFSLTSQYRSGNTYHNLLKFVSRFRRYSPYNAMLVHIQKPGSRFVASPSRWLKQDGRRIKPGAQALRPERSSLKSPCRVMRKYSDSAPLVGSIGFVDRRQ